MKPRRQEMMFGLRDASSRWLSRTVGREQFRIGQRIREMKRGRAVREQLRLLVDMPSSDMRTLLRSGGISFLFHIILITFMIFYLMAGGPGGGGEGNGGGSSVYRVTIRPLSSQDRANSPVVRGLTPTQAVFAKAHSKKEQQPAPMPVASTVELISRDEPVPGLGDDVRQEGTGAGGQGDGSGTGDGTGAGWNIFGWKGFGRSNAAAPRYLDNPKPGYPLEARQQGYEGKILLKVEVLQTGRVGEVKVTRSSGHQILDQSALTAVKKWRFIPARRGRIPILAWVNIGITYQLRDSSF
ncbi:MAG TPA: energy transducer TonB [Thermodesulfobacteriota bacterium]